MTAILTINATPGTLRAVVRDPTVRLWIQLDYAGPPAARCLVDGRPATGLRPPAGAAEAIGVVHQLLADRGIEPAAVAHRVSGDRPAAELIDDSFLTKLRRDEPARDAIAAALAMWPTVAQLAGSGSEPDAEAMVDHQARTFIGRQEAGLGASTADDDRVRRMLADPRGYFAQARERTRVEVEREIASRSRVRHRRSR